MTAQQTALALQMRKNEVYSLLQALNEALIALDKAALLILLSDAPAQKEFKKAYNRTQDCFNVVEEWQLRGLTSPHDSV